MRSCNYGQRERKRKSCLTVFSNVAHPQIPMNTCMDCMYGHNCRAETSPQTGRVPWTKGTEFSWRESWDTARIQEILEERFVHPHLATFSRSIGSLHAQIKAFVRVCAFKAWIKCWTSHRQLVYRHFLLPFSSSPAALHLFHCPQMNIISPDKSGN